ncbi:MAG: hypothetical protein K1X67_17055 [Fimbriimonadaceae bacterium]|nr:hypothetical protein [Fimbriimonadaceae bacterium]
MNHFRVNPDTDAEELHALYVRESGLHGADLRSFYFDQDWKGYQQRLARTLLLDAFSVFESWAEEVVDQVAPAGTDKSRITKGLQFPTKTDPLSGVATSGARWAIAELTSVSSAFMETQVTTGLRANPKYGLAALDPQLKMYRYFKEARNCLVHRSGRADKKVVEAYNEIAGLSLNGLGLDGKKRRGKVVAEIPATLPAVEGENVQLDLRGVVGLSDVIIRVMTTIDAEASRASTAEELFRNRWASTVKPKINFPAREQKRAEVCRSIAAKLRLPPFPSSEVVVAFARAQRLAT